MNDPSPYRSLDDAELNRQFMPRLAVPDHEHWLDHDQALSARAKDRLRPWTDRRYGQGPRQIADLYPAPKAGAPLLLFFHGGYWRALSKDYVSFLAEPIAQFGGATIIPNYDLCPAVSLAQIVGQARDALSFAMARAQEINADPNRIYVAGNSAGAHLAAMLLALEADGSLGLPHRIAGAVLITGIYDLRAILRAQVNDDVRLSEAEATALSPMLRSVAGHCKVLVSVGAMEPSLWIEQSRRFSVKLTGEGHPTDLLVLPRHHHFSITRSLGDSGAPLTRALIELMG